MSRPGPASAGRILVIEDQPEIAAILSAYLERAGFDVICTFDGEQGARALRQHQPDIVLLDLLLPKRDGRALLDVMSSIERPGLVIVSAQVDAHRTLAADARVDAVLNKPYDPNQVVALALKVMGTRSGGAVSG